MNKFIIAFSALLAVCSVCSAYSPNPGYGARLATAAPVLGGIQYQVQPELNVKYVQPSYVPVGPIYGLPSSNILPPGRTNLALALRALSIQDKRAVIREPTSKELRVSEIYSEAAPVIIPARRRSYRPAPGPAYLPAVY